jgi:hypothetical protein
MAISGLHYRIVRELHQRGQLRKGGAILELGEANWYYDIHPHELIGEIETYVEPERRGALVERLRRIATRRDIEAQFGVAKIFYEMYFAPSEVQAIDFDGSPSAHRLDLNAPVKLDRQFDVVINHGTAEHIFNIAQVFRTAHDYTLPGGMMIHEGPSVGWIDHGFYTLQPTLFYDLAEANGYDVVAAYIEDLAHAKIIQIGAREAFARVAAAGQMPENAMLMVIFRKGPVDRPFQVPRQHGYRGAAAS